MSEENEQLSLLERREMKIKRNDAKLQELGLQKVSLRIPPPAKRKTWAKVWKEKPGHIRRSKRLGQLLGDTGVQGHTMSAFDGKMDVNYLSKFKEYLVYGSRIGSHNEMKVLKQISKLAHGEGIRYDSAKYGWPEGCYFMKDKPLTLMSDVSDVLDAAIEFEDKWGEDRGNGWLLRRPLIQLLSFQKFCKADPDFMLRKTKLAQQHWKTVIQDKINNVTDTPRVIYNGGGTDSVVSMIEFADTRQVELYKRSLGRKRANPNNSDDSEMGHMRSKHSRLG